MICDFHASGTYAGLTLEFLSEGQQRTQSGQSRCVSKNQASFLSVNGSARRNSSVLGPGKCGSTNHTDLLLLSSHKI